jgi:hypothetical protein
MNLRKDIRLTTQITDWDRSSVLDKTYFIDLEANTTEDKILREVRTLGETVIESLKKDGFLV